MLSEKRNARWRALAALIVVAAAGLIAWTVYVGLALPHRFAARHWNLAWVGFDTLMAIVLGVTGWAAFFKKRTALAAGSLVCAALLACDAWFDSVTSWGTPDQRSSLLFALLIELPSAVFFLLVARRTVSRPS